MIKRLFTMGMLSFSLLFAPFGQASAALVSTGQPQTYQTTFTNADTALSGVATSKQFFFQIEDYWKTSAVNINLDYQATPLVEGDYSSVTLVMNGTKFHSFRPSVEGSKKQRLNVDVPKELLVDGNNTLTIEGYIQTTLEDQVCVPVERRDNWLQFYKTSGVVITHTNDQLDGSISDFNRQFIGLDIVGANAIAVPQQSQPEELEAAVYALSGFAKANPLKDTAIPMIDFDSGKLDEKNYIVAVALYDHLPDEIKNLLNESDLSDKALIQVVNVDKQPTLVITSQNAELLVKAGRLAANQELMGQLSGNKKMVDESTEVETPAVSINRNVVLSETGDQLKGIMHQEKTYFISLPANRSLAEASKISLDIRYANNLDFERSMVTVLVNDTPIGSKKLTSELANGDNVTLPIPKNIGITGNFNVTVAFDLELMSAPACMPIQNQMPWAFITKDSILQLNTKDNNELLLNNYPNPFLRDGSFNGVAVVLPQERDDYTYLTISNIFNLLGQYAEGNTGDVHFYEDSIEATELQKHNIIAIGSYQNNKVIREKNDKLYFKYNTSGEHFISNEKMSVDADYGKRIGTLQLIDSPYEAGRGLLAVTGASSESFYLASKLLATESTKWKVYGDGVVTDKDGNINAYRFKKQAEEDQSTIIEDVIQRGDVLGFIIAVVLVLVLILISLILIIRKYRRKRGGTDET